MSDDVLLVTGIHGLVGQYIFPLLNAWPGRVVITGRGPRRLPDSQAVYEELDITDLPRVKAVFEQYAPAVVIHSAAMAQPDQCEQDRDGAMAVNVKATEDLLEAAARSGAFFLYISSDFVFSGDDGPYDETSRPAPVNFYGKTKLLAEELVRNYGYPWAIVRPVLVYGNVLVGTRSNIISWVRDELGKGQPISVVSDQLRTPTFAGDLASAIIKISLERRAGVWHISGKDQLSPYDVALKVAAHAGLDSSLITRVDASVFKQPARRPSETPFIIEKARRELGYEPVGFEEGMRKVLG